MVLMKELMVLVHTGICLQHTHVCACFELRPQHGGFPTAFADFNHLLLERLASLLAGFPKLLAGLRFQLW